LNFPSRRFSTNTVVGILLGVIALLAVWLRLRHAAQSMVYNEMASMYFSGPPAHWANHPRWPTFVRDIRNAGGI
jgi:hypothetical protein